MVTREDLQDKYLNLTIEQQKILYMNVTPIQIVVGAIGTIPKSMENSVVE